jgi:gamma-glutamylcyclotransferase (GGCT)/AIG2-like uncharacterized protein YtfP
MRALYFAYGSNLKLARMHERVPSAEVLGSARLRDFRLACDKLGADGSGKANLHPDAGGVVWGAVYRLAATGWPALDACEVGYARIRVCVQLGDRPLDVWTYRSERLTDDPVAHAWYRRLILEGADEHRLPVEYQRLLAALPSR